LTEIAQGNFGAWFLPATPCCAFSKTLQLCRRQLSRLTEIAQGNFGVWFLPATPTRRQWAIGDAVRR
jgi:hypothetical protein